jgi:hypothetical protein
LAGNLKNDILNPHHAEGLVDPNRLQ